MRADQIGAREESRYLLRPGVGDDVEILGWAAEQQVADAASNKERLLTMRAKAGRDLACRAKLFGVVHLY